MSIEYYINNLSNFNFKKYYLFIYNGYTLGIVNSNVCKLLSNLSNSFQFTVCNNTLNCIAKDINLEQFFEKLTTYLVEFSHLQLRNERIVIKDLTTNSDIGIVDRALLPFLGIYAEGIHVNVYTKINDKIHLWIARRANHKVEPNKYDNAVAGAIAYGYTKEETVIKEANEEADIPKELAQGALYQISFYYCLEYGKQQVKNDCMHIFNLYVEPNFIPYNKDKEVANFYCWPLEKVKEILERDNDSFKYNSALAIIYFLSQNGYLNWENYYKYWQFFQTKSIAKILH